MDADVLVVGAGAAGLMAARRLARKGLRVIVLEARERIGGRVAEVVLPGSSERVELGAEFIHGAAPQTMALLREAGVGSSPIGDTGCIFDPSTGVLPDERDFGRAAALLAGARSLGEDLSVNAYLERFVRDEETRNVAHLARTFVEGFDAADPAIASVRGIAEEVASGVDFNSSRSDAGYAPVFAALYDSCIAASVEVRTSARVEKVVWRRGQVIVTYAQASLEARAVVVTVPVGVLQARAIAFDPPLPAAKQQAIEGIVMGPVVKVNFAFARAFWDAAFYRSNALSFGAYWTQHPKPGKSMVAWAAGPRAQALLRRSHDDVVEAALSDLTTMFGEVVRREFVSAAWHDWSSDPFSLGAYSYVRVGAMGSREALGASVEEALFFAGEATATGGQGGTVHGALATGERAADEVEGALC